MIIFTAPWNQPPLDAWSICCMNNRRENGEKFLFVSMAKDGNCIKAEGPDDREIWADLYTKAMEYENAGISWNT